MANKPYFYGFIKKLVDERNKIWLFILSVLFNNYLYFPI